MLVFLGLADCLFCQGIVTIVTIRHTAFLVISGLNYTCNLVLELEVSVHYSNTH